jgi:hypothetical protein
LIDALSFTRKLSLLSINETRLERSSRLRVELASILSSQISKRAKRIWTSTIARKLVRVNLVRQVI